ncbi:hypothetical protein NliqN6_1919 [Naganishia liquefaciens]|uniref:Organic hydroperoxide resistance protein n=1 Tax=Naganishia liquefaciens TaxID=104408 RepID=A0A8H3TQT2_9TREE|nr:hypothetical protein NliqN6_1919 [Naganishia liquefaciens]
MQRSTTLLRSLRSYATKVNSHVTPPPTGPVLYSTRVVVEGARNGKVKGESLDLGLTMSKALGGSGDKGKSNPEELFAAGYGACFQSAMNAAAISMGTKIPNESKLVSSVSLVGDMKKLDMGLSVKIEVEGIKGVEREQLQKIVDRAHEVCPYSRATRGNIPVEILIK